MCEVVEKRIEGIIRMILETLRKLLEKGKKKPEKPRLTASEKMRIDNYLNELREHFRNKKINDYLYHFQIPLSIREKIKNDFPITQFRKKTLSQLGISQYGNSKELKEFFIAKLKNIIITDKTINVEDYNFGILFHILQDIIELKSSIEALEILKSKFPKIRKIEFNKEYELQMGRFKNLIEKIQSNGN